MILIINKCHSIAEIFVTFRKFCAFAAGSGITVQTVTALKIRNSTRIYPRIKVFDAGGVDRGRFFDPVDGKWLSDVSQRHSARSHDLSGHLFVNGDVQLISRYVTPHKARHWLEIPLHAAFAVYAFIDLRNATC